MHLIKQFPALDHDLFQLFLKGVYPYELTNAWDKLQLRNLPPRPEFYNADSAHGEKMWNLFERRTMQDYTYT